MRASRRTLLALATAVLLAGFPATESPAKKKKQEVDPGLPTVHCNEVRVFDGVAYLAQTSVVTIMDISNPAIPRSLGSLGLPATLTGVAKEGNVLFLAGGSHGLFFVDVEDPSAPNLLQRFDTPGTVGGVEVRDGLVYLTDDRNGVRVLDVSNPLRPIQKARILTRDTVRGMALLGDRMAIAEMNDGARLFGIRRDGIPEESAKLSDLTGARDVALTEDLLLVAVGKRGLLVYSLAGRDPVLLSTVEPLRSAEHVSARGTMALVSNGTAGIQIVDLADPRNPSQWSTLKIHRNYPAGRVNISGSHAFVAVDLAGMAVIDLGEPAIPELVFPRQKRKMKVSFPTADSD